MAKKHVKRGNGEEEENLAFKTRVFTFLLKLTFFLKKIASTFILLRCPPLYSLKKKNVELGCEANKFGYIKYFFFPGRKKLLV